MKLRIEGTQEEISKTIAFLSGAIYHNPGTKYSEKLGVQSVSKFYPNKAFGFERSEPQKEGRVYVEIEA